MKRDLYKEILETLRGTKLLLNDSRRKLNAGNWLVAAINVNKHGTASSVTSGAIAVQTKEKFHHHHHHSHSRYRITSGLRDISNLDSHLLYLLNQDEFWSLSISGIDIEVQSKCRVKECQGRRVDSCLSKQGIFLYRSFEARVSTRNQVDNKGTFLRRILQEWKWRFGFKSFKP